MAVPPRRAHFAWFGRRVRSEVLLCWCPRVLGLLSSEVKGLLMAFGCDGLKRGLEVLQVPARLLKVVCKCLHY